MLSVAHVTKVL